MYEHGSLSKIVRFQFFDFIDLNEKEVRIFVNDSQQFL